MYNTMPYMMPQVAPKTGLSALLGKINIASILSNTQKTLSVVNQAIPLYYQIKPVFKNLKTLSKLGKEFSNIGNENNTSNNISSINNEVKEEVIKDQNLNAVPNPSFFI